MRFCFSNPKPVFLVSGSKKQVGATKTLLPPHCLPPNDVHPSIFGVAPVQSSFPSSEPCDCFAVRFHRQWLENMYPGNNKTEYQIRPPSSIEKTGAPNAGLQCACANAVAQRLPSACSASSFVHLAQRSLCAIWLRNEAGGFIGRTLCNTLGNKSQSGVKLYLKYYFRTGHLRCSSRSFQRTSRTAFGAAPAALRVLHSNESRPTRDWSRSLSTPNS